jgi:hypothetical protein
VSVAAEAEGPGGAAAAALQADVSREHRAFVAGGMALHSGSRGDG